MLLGLLGKRGGNGVLGDIETVRADLLDRLRKDFLDGRGGVDELYAAWLLGGNAAKSLVNALLERHALCLHAICRATGGHTQRRLLRCDVVDERERRMRSRDGQLIGIAYHLAIEAVGKRLVAGRGIVEAVAQDHLTGREGGAMTSCTNWARAASYSNSSQVSPIAVLAGSSSRARIFSLMAVPPGSRRLTTW